jgi:hypothetical protein
LIHLDHAVSCFFEISGKFELLNLVLAHIVNINTANRMEVILRSTSINLNMLHLELIGQEFLKLFVNFQKFIIIHQVYTLVNLFNYFDNFILFFELRFRVFFRF